MEDNPLTPRTEGKKKNEAAVTPSYKGTASSTSEENPGRTIPSSQRQKTHNVCRLQYASMKAFVVHGVLCRRPINDTIQDLNERDTGSKVAPWGNPEIEQEYRRQQPAYSTRS